MVRRNMNAKKSPAPPRKCQMSCLHTCCSFWVTNQHLLPSLMTVDFDSPFTIIITAITITIIITTIIEFDSPVVKV